MASEGEPLDLVADVIKKNDIEALTGGLAQSTWTRRQLVDGLFAAAASRNWQSLELLVEHNVPLVRSNRKGQTILHRIAASCASYPDVTNDLMSKILARISAKKYTNFDLDTFLNKRCSMSDGLTGYTVLHQVVAAKHLDCTLLLLDHGAKANIRSGFYLRTPLMEAASKGLIEIVNLLLERGAVVHMLDKGGQTALIYAAQCGKLACLKRLIDAKCNVNAQNYTGNSALMQAAWSGHSECIRVLLEAKADVYSTDFLGRSVLRYAVKSRNKQLLEMILGATEAIPQDLSIGKAVVELDDPDILRTLLDRGLPLKSSTSNDCVLHSAAEMGSVKCLQIILDRKDDLTLDLNLMNDAYGVSALQRACAYGNYDVVKMMLKAGADPDLPSRDGLTPLFYSMEVLQLILTKARGLECMKGLLRYGCDVNQKCAVRCRGSRLKINMSHLAYALLSCNLYAARMLVVGGANKYDMSYSLEHQPAEIFPRELLSSPSDRNTFIKSQLHEPFSLYHLSRHAVRHTLHTHVEAKIPQLPIPTHVQEYVNLCEIEGIIDEYSHKLDEEEPLDEDYEDSVSLYEDSDPELNFTTTDDSDDDGDDNE